MLIAISPDPATSRSFYLEWVLKQQSLIFKWLGNKTQTRDTEFEKISLLPSFSSQNKTYGHFTTEAKKAKWNREGATPTNQNVSNLISYNFITVC